ncbi:competence type IV pilus minor pilin ComGG [Heyndrickxia sp. NPDC080065]|uniref:competence type IV pilus minor pilin ComGG n=1 Tax=Heyndrickxia sp. NPDC080065 TaxID=3390568 RepID=UPI003D0631B5
MNNQKGYVFPLTLVMVLITFYVITASMEIYLSEKRYLKETEEYYLVNSMNAMAVKSLMNKIQSEDFMNKGTLFFNKGEVNFTIQKKGVDTYTIILDSSMENNRAIQSELLYSSKNNRIVKWIER